MTFERQLGENLLMVRAVALAWATAAGLSAVNGLMQYFGVRLNHTGVGEAFGNLRQRNQFATLLNIGLLAVLWLASNQAHAPHGSGFTAPSRWPMPSGLTAAALLGAGNAASSSRTGLFQLVLWWWLHGSAGTTLRSHMQRIIEIMGQVPMALP